MWVEMGSNNQQFLIKKQQKSLTKWNLLTFLLRLKKETFSRLLNQRNYLTIGFFYTQGSMKY